jgi:hypothetical protein
MRLFSDNAWLFALAFLTGCGSDDPASSPDSAAGPGDVGVSVTDATTSPAPEASADPGNEDAEVSDDSAPGEGDADRDAAVPTVGAADGSAPADAAGAVDAADASHGATCQHASDCRLASSCTSCDCLALGPTDKDPVCSGNGVECLVDPCRGHTAACQGGHCVSQ